jgi:hypothetical protein
MAAWFQQPTRVLIVAALLFTGGLPRTAGAEDPAQALQPYLRGIDLEPEALASAARGAVVVKLLRTGNERDVAAFGLLRVRASQDIVLSCLLDLDRSLGSEGRRFGRFGDPPRPEDVARASFDDSEYRELRDCRPGNCDFKLSALGMQMFAQQIDWSAPDAKAQVDRRLRDGLLRVAREYRKRGDSEILTYDDKRGVRPHDVWVELATQMSRWIEYPPELRRYLTSYPAGRPEGARDVLYWAEDRAPRIRPTLTLNHLIAYAPTKPTGAAFLARKQVYASHYLDGALELSAIVNHGPRDSGTYLFVVQLMRFDQLSGGVLNIRGRVQERLQEALRSDLERQRRAIEANASARP